MSLNWRKRILRIRNGKQEVVDDPSDEEASTRVMEELVPPTEEDIQKLKKGTIVEFYHCTGDTVDGLWLKGEILQRVTKKEEARRSEFNKNWYNIGNLSVIENLGATASSIPNKVMSINLTKNTCWRISSNKSDKTFSKLISSMNTEGTAFYLEANDVVHVEKEKEPQEEDQDETNTPKPQNPKTPKPHGELCNLVSIQSLIALIVVCENALV